jgi:hypothetical protein
MHTRTLVNAGVFVLLLVLTIEVAGMSRSLRRIEHEERRLVTHCAAEGRGSVLTLIRPFSTISGSCRKTAPVFLSRPAIHEIGPRHGRGLSFANEFPPRRCARPGRLVSDDAVGVHG